MEQQEGEQGSHPLPVQGDRAAVLDDRQRAENAEFDGNMPFVALACPDE
jgi:hypothetical protein